MSEDQKDQWKFQKEFNEFFRKSGEPPITEKEEDGMGEGVTVEEEQAVPQFDMKPEELLEYLDQYVVKQDSAKEIIATKVCTHFNRLKLGDELEKAETDIKNNIIMIGPTGVGKTYIIRLVAKKVGVPFVKADATKFSETGYVGGDVDDLVRELVNRAVGNIGLAQNGIIYVDEIDKIASVGTTYGPDVSRSGVQRNLLKLMEETEVDLKAPHDLASQMESVMQYQRSGKIDKKRINTKNILFIVSGAFSGLDELIARRLKKRDIGFGSGPVEERTSEQELLHQVKAEDLIAYGFESEFVGRLPVISVLEELDEEDLYTILTGANSSVILAKKLDFKSYGITLEFEDGALRKLARLAHNEKTGARGLVSALEKTLMKYERRLPSTGVKRMVVTEEIVDDPEKHLQELVFNGSLETFREEFHEESGVWLDFDEAASDELRRKSESDGIMVDEICRKLFQDYSLGLKLIDIDSFRVTMEVFEKPKEYLDDIIKEYYGRKKSK
jgi:endopeptidase Clp ATP-binding regulatory subunit ClpX